MSLKGSEIIQCLPHPHAQIESHLVRNIGERALHLYLMLDRVKAKHAHLPVLRPEQVEQALNGGGFACAVATQQSVAAARIYVEAQAAYGFCASVSIGGMVDFDSGMGPIQGRSILLRVFMGAPLAVKRIQAVLNQFEEFLERDRQVVGLHDGVIHIFNQEFAPGRMVLFEDAAAPPAGSQSPPGFPVKRALWQWCCG